MKVAILFLILCFVVFGYGKDDERGNGSFSVKYRETGWPEEEWTLLGSASLDEYPSKISFMVPQLLNKRLFVSIEQESGGSSQIDCVGLETISSVVILPSSSNLDAHEERKLLLGCNEDIVNSYFKPIVLEFDDLNSNISYSLSVVGRIEPERSISTSEVPFVYPTENLGLSISEMKYFYHYRLESGRKREEEVKSPFQVVYFPVGSGHPQGSTYFWVENDEKFLYVDIDFTPDSTVDDDVDYAKVVLFSAQEKATQQFEISQKNSLWGYYDFTYTPRAAYQHKVYHFRIPLGDEFVGMNGVVDLAFVAYGSAEMAVCTPSCNSSSSYETCVYPDFSKTGGTCANASNACIGELTTGPNPTPRVETGDSGDLYTLTFDGRQSSGMVCCWDIAPTNTFSGQSIKMTYSGYDPTYSGGSGMVVYGGHNSSFPVLLSVQYNSTRFEESSIIIMPSSKQLFVEYQSDSFLATGPQYIKYELMFAYMEVIDDATQSVLINGGSEVDFGAVDVVVDLDRVINVKCLSSSTTRLELYNLTVEGSGFSILDGFNTSLVEIGSSTSFTLRFENNNNDDDDDSGSSFSGTVRFDSNAGANGQDSFSFVLSAAAPSESGSPSWTFGRGGGGGWWWLVVTMFVFVFINRIV